MRFKKSLTLLLVLSMLLSALAACGDTKTAETTADTAAAETAETETETTRVPTNLPDSDFEGYAFHIIYEKINRYPEVDVEELNGETINDAVYQRNAAVEDLYNVTIEGIMDASAANAVKAAVNAGDNAYDITMATCLTTANMATTSLLLDINEIPYIDLSKPWYDQYANDAISIGHKQHMIVGDINIRDNDSTYLLMFNQKLATELGVDNLYDMALEGTWTMDRMTEILQLCAVDLNGDGVQNEHDQWGLLGEAWNTNVYIAGAGEYVFRKDENDIPYIAMNTERYFDVFNRAYNINGNKEYSWIVNDYPSYGGDVWGVRNNIFKEDRSLFFTGIVGSMGDFREMVTDFGIMPIPKYDEAQENYHSILTLLQATAVAVPKSMQDADRTGILVEALSAEGLYILTPAYYDICVTTKFARDEIFTQILDMVFSARIFELGLLYDWGKLFYVPSDLTAAHKTDLASRVEKVTKSAETALGKTLAALEVTQ